MSATEFGDLFSAARELARSLASQNATIAMFESRALSSAVIAARGFDIPKLFGNPTMSAFVEFEQRQKLEWCEHATTLRNSTSGVDIRKLFDQNSVFSSLNTALTEFDPLTQLRRACDSISGLHVDAPRRNTSSARPNPSKRQGQEIVAPDDRIAAKLTSTPTLRKR